MNESKTWVIETQTLSKSYKEVQALKPLDLQITRNSIFGFLGPNGAGKTTTIKLLLGLIRPSGGSARVFGLDNSDYPAVATAVMTGDAVPTIMPVLATFGFSILFVAANLWAFEREEF